MSADNCIAILVTTDTHIPAGPDCTQNNFGPITAYRVKHIQGHDGFHDYRTSEIHNLGWWMASVFADTEPVYDLDLARQRAGQIEADTCFTEYGIITLDAHEFNFPGY